MFSLLHNTRILKKNDDNYCSTCRNRRRFSVRTFRELNHGNLRIKNGKSSTKIVHGNARIGGVVCEAQTGSEVDVSSSDDSVLKEYVVGVLGGGQLGRMMGLAAANLGIQLRCLDPTPNAPASIVAEQVVGCFRDRESILNFARGCDVVTVEIEHVDADALESVVNDLGIDVQPTPHTLRIIQDKFRQKQYFESCRIPVANSFEVTSRDILEAECKKGGPVMLKSKMLAYDGRGNYVIQSDSEIDKAVETLGGYGAGLYMEEWMPFAMELAVMVARSGDGSVVSYPLVQTIHKDNICYVTEAPANVPEQVALKAKEIAEKTVASLDGAGVFGVEMFLLPDGEVYVNEVAPRPHNSGHYTIDGCWTSQFEQHLRAVLGWPLGNADLSVGCVIMVNLLGEADGVEGGEKAQKIREAVRGIPGASLHWYGKKDVRKNRKVRTNHAVELW